MNVSFDFCEFLLVESQFAAAQNFARLAQDWCSDWNLASRKFALGYSYLHTV